MTTHELKLDIKYFDDVKSGKKNFEIRKNNRDFKVGDILELIAFNPRDTFFDNSGEYQGKVYHFVNRKRIFEDKWESRWKEQADTIKVKILNVVQADEYNGFHESVNGVLQSIKWANSYQETYIKTINEVIKDYFHTDQLPDDYVVLGIEVVE